MRNIADINVTEIFVYITNAFKKTTKKQRISAIIIFVVLVVGFIFGKELWQRYSLQKQAEKISAEVSQVQTNFFKTNKKYKKDIFAEPKLKSSFDTFDDSFDMDDDIFLGPGHRRRFLKQQRQDFDFSTARKGDFTIESDAENGCLVIKHGKNISHRTVFYSLFNEEKVYCQGKNCLKKAKNNEVGLCYKDGICFPTKQLQETQRSCGDNHGKQTRKCTPSCENGLCEEWSECKCDFGFEWDGTTCKQKETEKDCTDAQCFNGLYCENKGALEKNIPNGSCKRVAVCQKNIGWNYTAWECSCNSTEYCSSDEQCLKRPQNQAKKTLPGEGNYCTNTSYTCVPEKGWIEKAEKCVCTTIGTFWDAKAKETKCSPCITKPKGAVFTSAGGTEDKCSWKCSGEYQSRKGTCAKPNGQYLCARTELQICTDEFSKNRKMQKDAKKTNEGQACFVEDKDNVLFYNQKEKTCQICQCVDLTNGKISN